jgi:hypothetical protein
LQGEKKYFLRIYKFAIRSLTFPHPYDIIKLQPTQIIRTINDKEKKYGTHPQAAGTGLARDPQNESALDVL